MPPKGLSVKKEVFLCLYDDDDREGHLAGSGDTLEAAYRQCIDAALYQLDERPPVGNCVFFRAEEIEVTSRVTICEK